MIIFGAKKYTDEIDLVVRNKVEELYTDKVLAIVLIGKNKASQKFVEIKKKFAQDFNIDVNVFQLGINTKKREVYDLLEKLNLDDRYGGIIVQYPFPEKFTYSDIASRISPAKDVDFFNPQTYGEFTFMLREDFMPPTARALDFLVRTFKFDFKGRTFLIVGQGVTVGRPISTYLLSREATVISANEHSQNLTELLKISDVVITGANSPRLIRGENLKKGASVIDFSYNIVSGKIVGDFDELSNIEHLSLVCKSPGGIGPLTVRYLFLNFLDFVEKKENQG